MTTGTLKTDPNVFSLQTLPTVFGKSTQLCQLRQLYHSSFVYISISWINSFLINPVNTDNWLKYFPTPELTVLRKSTQLCQLRQLDLSSFVYMLIDRFVKIYSTLITNSNVFFLPTASEIHSTVSTETTRPFKFCLYFWEDCRVLWQSTQLWQLTQMFSNTCPHQKIHSTVSTEATRPFKY